MAENLLSGASETSLFGRIEIEKIDPLSGETWDREVLAHPEHSVFHRSGWAKVLEESYGHRPFYLKCRSESGGMGWIPLMEVNSPVTGRRGVSLPFSDFAGPLWTGNLDADEAYGVISRLALEQRWRHFDIRHTEMPPSGAEPYVSFEGHVLDLRAGEESVERSLDAAVRRAIRKAGRSGLEISIDSGITAVSEFYGLHCETRRRHGLPPQPFRFFKSIQRNLLACGLGEVVLVWQKERAVAGAIFLRSADRAVYKFGASDASYWELRPNQWAMWHGIRHLISLGCSELHFGRTSKGDDGLSRFKRSWGCRTEALNYFRHDTQSDRWLAGCSQTSQSHQRLFGRMPLCINRFAGGLIYPHLD